ncbi:MAG: ribokinase, partial [Acetobacteraceae bacterium]|nr:ribokinase [Acetobacteraceae bacterium]
MKPILVIGSINTDLVVRAPRLPLPGETLLGDTFRTFPGGKGANQAVGVARLGHPVALLGKLGRDRLGDELLSGLSGAGVDCHSIERASSASGVALITTEEGGQNTIIVVAGANGDLLPLDVRRNENLIKAAGMVLLQLEIPLASIQAACEIAEGHGVPVMLDPAPAAPLAPELLKRVTWLTPNETEAATLLGDS